MYKRKALNLAVKRHFQRWLFLRIMASVLAAALLAGLILYGYAYQEVSDSFFDAHVKIQRVSDLLLPVVVAGSLVSLISGLLLAIFLPQKIAGPVYRIEQDLAAIRAGDLDKRIRLRHGDQLQDLATNINSTVDTLVSRIREPEGEKPQPTPSTS